MSNIQRTLQNLIDDGKIIKDNNRLLVRNKMTEWKSQARLYGDEYLDRLKDAMLKVFCEGSPVFDMDKTQRLFSYPQDKRTHYSNDIRTGLATELALIGNYKDLLENCSTASKENFAADIIRNIFNGISWKQMATLDPVLPLLAEADPDAFLSEMGTLAEKRVVFTQLIDDEGGIFEGGFHWLGIIDALKTLAWEPDYLIRVVLLLAKLALLDKNRNTHPRPMDALSSIFWPYLPQTCADDKKLVAAASVLLKKHHQLGWKILVRSINAHTGTFNRLPKVRKSLPDDFDNSPPKDRTRLLKLVEEYETLMLEYVSKDSDLAYPLSLYLEHLRCNALFPQALSILSSQDMLNMDDEFKEPIWTELRKLCIKHRLHKKTDWAISEDKLQKIDRVIELLQPKSLLFQSKYLFDGNSWDWHLNDDYDAESNKFRESGAKAVKSVFAQSGINGIFDLLKHVQRPFDLGIAVSLAKIRLDNKLISSLLDDSSDIKHKFIEGYLLACYEIGKDKWLSSFKDVELSNTQKVTFLCSLPFCSQVWLFCATWLGDDEKLYWQACQPCIPSGVRDGNFAIKKAMVYGRPDIAAECLFWNIQRKGAIVFKICAQALLELARSSRSKNVDRGKIQKLISVLQKHRLTRAQRATLIQIEFLYLPLLDSSFESNLSPATLDSALAENPELFHQVLEVAYKSNVPSAATPVKAEDARKAFDLLFQWKKMPGVIDGILNYNIFKNWYDEVVELCNSSGLLRQGQTFIGSVLFYSPADPAGLWIDKNVAALLDQKENDILRNGYYAAAFNSRGVHAVDMSGEKDLDIAQKCKDKASDLEDAGFLNFAEVFRTLARSYEDEAKKWKAESKRLKYEDEL